MTRSFLLLVSLFFTVTAVIAQGVQAGTEGDVLKSLQEQEPEQQVTLEVDSLLVDNYYKLITRNIKSSGIPGYRIRIYSGSGIGAKKEQQQVRARFLSLYPGLDAYNRYDEPFFKIYVGDCRTRSEALKLSDMIRKDFPDTFIREDHINLGSGN